MSYSLPAPFDVKLMNVTATVLFVGVAALGLAAVSWWALRHPAFNIGRIVVEGELVHNNTVTLRANVAPVLTGNFFTVDLKAAKAAFEAMGKRVLGEPRIGAHGTLIFFVHPKDMQGVLIEIMEVGVKAH